MVYIVLLPATALSAIWVILLSMVEREDWVIAAYNKVFENRMQAENLRAKEKTDAEKLSRYRGAALFFTKLLTSADPGKKVKKLEARNELLKSGNLKYTSIFPMPGYVLQRRFSAIGKGGLFKSVAVKHIELYGRKHAGHLAKHMLAKLLSYPLAGISALLFAGSIFLSAGNATTGAAIIGVGPVLVMAIAYAMYDELRDRMKKRRERISRQFPNVVSKLALLVTSGMVMDRAWKETAFSQDSELYLEMRKTSQELDNLVSPEAAYSSFINRCSTKETAKLASAIMQNLSKGNVEIGRLLKDMAREAWLERRHTAKRDAEKANSKLMIPTMLLFVSILLMLLVPVAMNFSV